MPKKIDDRFSRIAKKMGKSHQYASQLRNRAKGVCITCGKPLATKNHCIFHAVQQRERTRKFVGCKARSNSLTYRIQNNPGGKIANSDTNR